MSETGAVDQRSHGRYGRRGLPAAVVDRMYRDYQRLKSLSKTAALHGRTRQSMWEILKTRKLQLRTRRFREKVMHNGEAYTMHKGYLRRTRGNRVPLHHVIWTEANGPIPDGHNLHFKDGNPKNCLLTNIVCAPIAEISRITSTGDNQFTKAREAQAVIELDSVLRGMAANAARKHFSLSIDAADLAQAGRIAVGNAVRRFDREKFEGPWRPYAIAAARNAMASWIRKHGRNVRTPSNKFFTAGVSEVSIQAPVSNDSDSSTFEELFLGQDETTTGSVDRAAMFQALAKRMKRLPAADRALLHAYYFKEQTLHQIAVGMGVTRQAIHLRMKRIIATLRRSRNLKRVNREVAAA